MRLAKATDHWRHLCHNPPQSTRLHRLRFSSVDAIGTGEIDFTGSIVGICGANGAGKSTLLSLLYLVLSKQSESILISSRSIGHFDIQEFEADVASKKISGLEMLSACIDGAELNVCWIDGATQASAIRHLVERDENFGDFLDQTSPKISDQDSLDEISYLIGKSYTKCLVYEIEDYAEYSVFPYFEVTSDGVTYKSENMGKGELSALLAHWYIKHAKTDSILLLEEPEAHLPVRTQTALMNILAREVLEKKLFVVLSTHSASILKRLKPSDLRMLSRLHGSVRISKEIGTNLLKDMFGVQSVLRAVFLVEDLAAVHFLSTIFDVLRPELSASIAIVDGESSGDVLKALKAFPSKGLDRIHLAGVLDGDLKTTFVGSKECEWPIFFLPGSLSPEELLMQCDFTSLDFLSKSLNVSEDQLHAAFGYIVGEDHHDWLTKFVQLIGRSYKDGCEALTKYWLEKSSNRFAASKFIVTIEKWLAHLDS
jgi:predicted ATPase